MHTAFQVLVSGLKSEGELPRWLPYGRFGTSSFLLLMYVTPVAYATAMAAAILPVADALLLFKVCVLLEFLLFLAGSIRLSLLLFRGLAPVAIVNIGAILSFSWLSSLDANFRNFYFLPFILDALIRFTREGRVTHLLVAALCCVASAVGNFSYYPPMMALTLTVFCGALLWARGVRLPPLRFAKVDLLLGAGLLTLAAAHVGAYWINLRGLHFTTPGRDPQTGKALLHFYLHFNGNANLPDLAKVFISGAHTHGDLTFYIGLAPLALAFLAVSRCRRAEFAAVAATTAFLVLFSFGGIVTRASYYFPGMAYVRNVGLVLGTVKYLLLLMAGFGLEALLSAAPIATGPSPMPTPQRRIATRGALAVAGLLAAIDLALSVVRPQPHWSYLLLPVPLELVARDFLPALIRIGVYGLAFVAAFRFARQRPSPDFRGTVFTRALLLAFLIDVGSFKVLQLSAWPRPSGESMTAARSVFTARPPPWQPLRVSSEQELRQNPGLRFAVEEGVNTCVYVSVYSLIGMDPRMPEYRLDSIGESVDQLFKNRNVALDQRPKDRLLPADDWWLQDALGARLPKLRIVPEFDVDFCGGEQAPSAVRRKPLASGRLVLEGVPTGAQSPPPGSSSVSVTSFGYNHLSAQATVEGTGSAWLYYADAFDEGWSARVDGRSVPISRANLAFKSLPLTPGTHRVEFQYRNVAASLCLYGLCGGSVLFLAGLGVGLIRSLRTPGAAGT